MGINLPERCGKLLLCVGGRLLPVTEGLAEIALISQERGQIEEGLNIAKKVFINIHQRPSAIPTTPTSPAAAEATFAANCVSS